MANLNYLNIKHCFLNRICFDL